MANYPNSDLEVKAWNFAKEKHKGQVRKFTNASYFEMHVQKVNGILKMYTSNKELLAASLLHDVLEDCYEDKDIGYDEISNEFGSYIADIVYELTSDKQDIEVNYFGSKSDYLIDKLLNMSDGALIIKLCDRLQNISDAFTASETFRNSYYKETKEIADNLRKLRSLTKRQSLILSEIESKISNVNSIFKIERIVSFDKFKL